MYKYLIIGAVLLAPIAGNATCMVQGRNLGTGDAYYYCTDGSAPTEVKNKTPADVIRAQKEKLEEQSREMQKKWFDFSNERGDLETRLNQYRDALRKLEQSSDVPSSPIPPVKPEEKK